MRDLLPEAILSHTQPSPPPPPPLELTCPTPEG